MKSRLTEERKRLGLTQDKIAKLGGISMRSYCDYENGISEPKAGFLTKVAEAGIDILYVLTGIRSQQTAAVEPPANYADLNKKKMDKLMDDLNATQQAELIKQAEEKKRLNQCEIELTEFKKRAI